MSLLSNLRSFTPYIGMGLGAAGLASLFFFGNSRNAEDYSQVSNPVVQTSGVPESPELPTTDDYGGAKDTLISSLTGVSNRENRWGVIPTVYGKKVKIFPMLATQPATAASGITQSICGIFECGPGELEFEDPKISGRPITDFPTLQLQYQYGKTGDAPFTLYTELQASSQINEALIIEAAPKVVTKTCPREGINIGITLAFPSGLYKRNATTGAPEPYTVRVWIGIKNKTTGVSPHGAYFDITGQQVGPFFWSRAFAVTQGLYEVSILRYTPNQSTTPDIVDACVWTELTTKDSGQVFYDQKNSIGQPVKMARIAYSATSTEDLQGSLGEFSILATSKLPTWNGSVWSDPVATANPAWIILDILRSAKSYRPLSDSEIDLPAFLSFATWCEEKGFEYNKVIEGGADVYSVCQEVASAGRAVFYLKDGKVSILIDKPVDTIAQHFTPRNILFESFSAKYSFVEPADYLSVSFVNPEVDWQQDSYNVYDDGKVKGVDFKRDASLSFPGVTKTTQLYKLARYFQAVNRLRTGFYSFGTDIENLRCQIGDRIKVTHDRLAWGLGQGRITAVTTNGSGAVTAVTLDASQYINFGTRYSLNIRLSNGESILDREVTVLSSAETKTFTFATPIPNSGTLPAKGDLVTFGELGQSGVDLLVTGIELAADLSATIYAVDYAPQVYEADAGTIPAFVSVISRTRRPDMSPPAPVIFNALSDETVLDTDIDGSLRTRILITFLASVITVTHFDYQVRLTGSEQWSPIRRVSATGGSLSIYEVQDGLTYDVRVRSVAGFYFSNDWTFLNAHLVIGKTTKPPSVMLVYRKPNSNVMGWVDIERPRDFSHYEIRMALGDNENYDQATVIGRTTDNQIDLGAFARGLKTFSVKAVDTSGNQSEVPAILKTDFGDISENNVEYVETHHPVFPGTKTNCSVVDNKLVADGVGDNVYSDDDEAFIYTDDEDDFYRGTYSEAVYESVFVIPPGFTPPFRWYIRSSIIATGYRIEYKPPVESYFYSDGPLGDDELVYSNDDNDNIYDDEFGDWLPFPTNGVELDGAYSIPWRIVLFSGVIQGQIIELEHVLDLPDKVVYYNDIDISASGTRLPTPADFSRTDYVSVTLQSATGKIVLVTEKTSPLGPLVIVQDRATGAGVTGVIDAEVRGIA